MEMFRAVLKPWEGKTHAPTSEALKLNLKVSTPGGPQRTPSGAPRPVGV